MSQGEIPNIRNLIYVETDVGKTWKSTKKHFVWEFTIDEKHHKIEMYDSKMSGKKKVIKDGKIIFEDENSFDVTFSHAFTINEHACTLIQYGENYELRINNNSFNYLMDLEKNKLFFGSNAKRDPTSTTIINNSGKLSKNFANGFNKPNETNQKPVSSGGFNFAIKPVSNPPGNFTNSNKPQFTHVPGGLSKQPVKQDNKTSISNTNNNNNLLIDFGGSEPVQQEPIQNTNNAQQPNQNNLINLLGDIDFNQTSNNIQAIVPVDNSQPVNNKPNNSLVDFDFLTSSNQTNTMNNNTNMINMSMMNSGMGGINSNPNFYGNFPAQVGMNNQFNMGAPTMNQYGMNNQSQINMGFNMGGNQNMNFGMNNNINNNNNVKKSVDPLDSLFN